MMKKVLKILGIIILIAIILLLIHSVRNFIIIKNLQEKFSKYEFSSNYHIKSVAQENQDTTMTINYYKKGNNQVTIMERKSKEETIKVAMYDNGDKVDVFTDNGQVKTYRKNASSSTPGVELVNYFHTDNDWQTFLIGAFAMIRTENYNNTKCYVINNFNGPDVLVDKNKNELYVDEKTGLCVKNTLGEMTTQKEYEFEIVNDSIFIEPDISEYTALEN